ncbi:protein kinase domain-containing protein [Polyangium fumosum]|uniref:protein kinase domain-containing protein n=1 Tax=Polyangium fumosum TaxID=889272 RepID=UPI001478E954|nr:protein kinase [Polyangium fumosum]
MGRVLDVRYRVERVLGQGGMGLVLAVRDAGHDAWFALKLLVGERAGRLASEQRFRREAEITKRVRSPHVAEVHHVGRLVTGELYILMEYLEGKDLGKVLERRGALPFQEALQYVIQACAGLSVAHRALLAFVTEGLSSHAATLLRAAVVFADEPLSLRAFGRLLDMPVGDVADAWAELDRYGLVCPRSTPEASRLRSGMAWQHALGVEPAWVAACFVRVTTWLSRMPALYQEIEARSVGAVVVEVKRLAQRGAAAAPRWLAELSQVLGAEAPRLVDEPDVDAIGRRLGQTVPEGKRALARYPRFLAQLRDAALELGCNDVREAVEAALREANAPWLRRRTYHQQAKPKLLGIHDATVTAVAVSADGTRAVSGAADGSLCVYDVETRSLLAELRGRSAPLRRLALSADGRMALSAAEDGALEVWDLDERRRWCTLEGHGAPVDALAISADGRRAVSAAEDGFVCVWDLRKGRALRSLSPYAGVPWWPMSVAALAFSEDDGRVMVASPRGTIWWFEVDSGAVVRSLGIHESPLGFSRTSSRTLVHTKGPFGGLRFRDVESGAVVCEVGATLVMDPAPVAACGEHCIVAEKDAVARVYSLETGELRRRLVRHRPGGEPYLHQYYGTTGHTGRVTAVAASLDGRTAITGGADHMVLSWDVEHGPVARYEEKTGPAREDVEISVLVMTPEGEQVITTCGSGKDLTVWDVRTGEPVRTLRLPDGVKHPNERFRVAGRRAYIVGEGAVHVLDLDSGNPWVASARARALAGSRSTQGPSNAKASRLCKGPISTFVQESARS